MPSTRAYRRRQEALEAAAAEAEAEALAHHILAEAQGSDKTDLPDGLYDMLQLKSTLQRELVQAVEKPIVVSVELFQNEWVFFVRGYDPPFRTWNGHKVFFMRGKSVGPQRN